MKNNLTCEIVEDLMPSYIDSLTSEVTNKAVREHLSQCDKCKNKLDTMSEPCSEDKIEQEKKEYQDEAHKSACNCACGGSCSLYSTVWRKSKFHG